MNKSELLKKLSEISGEMENFVSDSNMLTLLKDFREIQVRLDELINEIEDEDEASEA